MKKRPIYFISVVLLSFATTAQATFINFRHEYIGEENDREAQHRDRFLVGHTFDNGIGFSAQVKWGYDDDTLDFSNMKDVGHEASLQYNYKVSDTFKLQPAYDIDSTPTLVQHKLNLLGTKMLSDTWSLALRYRYGYRVPSSSSEHTSYYHQINTWAFYRGIQDLTLILNIQAKAEEHDNENNPGYKGNHIYFGEFTFTSVYTGFESNWEPYFEFSMLALNTDAKEDNDPAEDSYVPRYRIGLTYNF